MTQIDLYKKITGKFTIADEDMTPLVNFTLHNELAGDDVIAEKICDAIADVMNERKKK